MREGAVPQSCSLLSSVKFVDGGFSRDDRCVEHLAVSFDGHRLGTQYVVYKVFHAVLKTMKEQTEGHGYGDELKDVEVVQSRSNIYPTSFKELTSKFSFPVSSWQLCTALKETDSPCITDSQYNPWKNLS